MARLTDTQRRILKSVAMFSSLNDEQIDMLVGSCSKVSYTPHEPICRAGDIADCFYVILAGHVKIFKLAPNGAQQVLHIFGPGQTFAEAVALKHQTYPAHAEAMEKAVLLRISKAAFDKILVENIDMVAGLVAGLSAKLRELANLAEELSLKTVPARLAGVLVDEMNRAGSESFTLSSSKQQIAERIGTTPETLSRSLKKFSAEGLIEVSGKKVTVLNAESLKILAMGV